MENIGQTILSQYANAAPVYSIIEARNQAIDPSALIDDWYNHVWNVQTAQGYGLDVWGRIVGVSRVLTLTSANYLGFEEANDLTEVGWNQAPWYSGSSATTNYRLSDSAYRQLIYAKALSNISDGSILSINAVLMTLFGAQGDAYVKDNGDMTMTYVFDFVPTDVQVSIIQTSGVLPRPTGVSVSYSIKASS
ncbi:DUF2612 domain-containing protein [Gluconobacter sphaericus]|uniref:Uncharacterized protein n=2 Tax=Gluconobacter TaxID=441 RepID=A0AA37SFB4_9PROT|nr:DUF2612 domain-containing protein [Gluconobacter sphaericus]MBF0885553.1 DUF2612 domain-containing protein [Gluconobacter sphaericus]GBR56528.1 hypothetical protein AA12467_2657 [Gluconobacter sphaericus NBRC 12467]GEB42791.1 hypothetical protein GSP01_15730 [Gluconobacter sphaericus NBRC 12467]GLQ84767.1 hypothetical protein GCM10007872_16750 [Gluconobacter sphaericus NBRC 12467]GLQ85078.1 hypothetical protein GCM10007872_19860 [Gluconobacter sphaericus NBRC 12467]